MKDVRVVLRMRTWLVLSHVAALLMPVAVLVFSGALAADLRAQTEEDLLHQGALVGLLASTEVRHARETDPNAGIAAVADRLSPSLQAVRNTALSGVRVLDERGIVVAASTPGVDIGLDLSDSPEVAEALSGQTGEVVRPRPPPERNPLASESRRASVRLFVATPILVDDRLVGVVLLSRTPREEVQALYRMVPWWGAVGALAATVGLALGSAYLFSRSLVTLAHASHRIAEGSVALDDLEKPVRSHVAEVRELARAVTTMADRLQQRLGYITEFAGNVSHEFRTPISALRGSVELLRDDEAMPLDQRARFLENALADLARMDRLVTGLLALARAEESAGQRPLDLQELLVRVAGEVDVPFDGKAAPVVGTPAQLEAIVANLVENARRHGGDDVHVRLVGWTTEDATGFVVEDDGRGISAANLPRIFDRFFTTARDVGGTGLGLALVRAVAVAHGGQVDVESRAGLTRFRVSFPRSHG